MDSIQKCALPTAALLCKYLKEGAYADCYATDIPGAVSHAEYVEAFYTTFVFKIERMLLSWFVSRPSTDLQAQELASGRISSFAAWRVEARSPDQLLLCDFQGNTRSWLMSVPVTVNGSHGTRLYFGSAVVPVMSVHTGEAKTRFVFRALLGFHTIYSRVLLRAAVSRLARSSSTER